MLLFFSSGAFEASRPGVWVEVHCGERLIMEKCACVCVFLRFKVSMVWELLGSEAAHHWSKKSDSAIWSTTRLLVLCELPL